MVTKILTTALALLMGFTFSAFAGDNKTNKEATTTPTSIEVATTSEAISNDDPPVYYWYDPITGFPMGDGPSETSPNACEGGIVPCALGYINPTTNPSEETADKVERHN